MVKKSMIVCAGLDSGTAGTPGARFGPKQILHALEHFSLSETGEYEPRSRKSLLKSSDLDQIVTIAPIIGDHEASLGLVKEAVIDACKVSFLPLVIGGDHSVTIPSVEALSNYLDFVFICFDAHLDYIDSIHGIRTTNESTILRCRETTRKPVVHIGLRNAASSSTSSAKSFFKDQNIMIGQWEISEDRWKDQLLKAVSGKNVYLSIDLDVLNTGEAPGVGTQSPGGMTFSTLDSIVYCILREGNLVGYDVVELCPLVDRDNRTAILAAQLIVNIESYRRC